MDGLATRIFFLPHDFSGRHSVPDVYTVLCSVCLIALRFAVCRDGCDGQRMWTGNVLIERFTIGERVEHGCNERSSCCDCRG